MKFYNLSTDKLITELDTDFKNGLSNHQAQERLNKDGKNLHVYNKTVYHKSRLFRVLFFVCICIMIYIALSLFKKDVQYISFGIATVIFPAVFSFGFYLYSKHVKNKLKVITPFDYAVLDVVRDGKTETIKYADITYGDVVLLKKGDYIPFDARIIESEGFVVDQTSVTSENNVKKRADIINDENIDVSKLHNMVFCSSYVVKGSAKVVVTDISKRVIVRKKFSGDRKKTHIAVKVTDFFRVLSLLLLALSVVFSVITALILSDYISFVISALLLAGALTCDFMSSYIETVFEKCCCDLYKKGVYVKNTAFFDRLGLSDVLLLKHSALFDKSTEISGFVTENDEYRQLSEINKSNFSVFLYSSLCNDSVDKESPYFSFKKLTLKILKGVGIDYEDIKSMCPVISQYSDIDSDYDVCGIVYDGSNVLIARGDYSAVLKLCGQDIDSGHREAIDRLSRNSTEIIAVAVKQVDIINDDLSGEKSGFKLAGFIGLRRSFSKDKINMLKNLQKSGIHTVLLFSGNETLAKSFSYKKNTVYADYRDMLGGNDFQGISECDVVYNFDSDMEKVCNLYISAGHTPVYIGNKSEKAKKAVAFNTCKNDMYTVRYNDAVASKGITLVYDCAMRVKSAFSAVRDLLVNTIVVIMMYVVCGILFALLNGQALLSPQLLSAVVFLGVPLSALFTSLCVRRYGLDSTAEFLNEPLQKKSIIFSAVSCIMFILLTVVLKFTVVPQVASGFIAVAFMSYAVPAAAEVRLNDKSCAVYFALGFLPAVLTAVILSFPVCTLFYVSSFTVLHALLSLVLGAAVKCLAAFISRSVNF